MVRKMLMITMAVGLATSSAFGQVIRLSDKAVVEPGQDVRLGNIATISGTDAQTAQGLADTVVLPAVTGNKTVRAEAILMAVIAQHGAENIATQLQLSGSASCEIVISTGAKAAPAAAAPVAIAPVIAAPAAAMGVIAASAPVVTENPTPAMVTASVVSAAAVPAAPVAPEAKTLSQMVVDRLSHELKVAPSEFRLNFGSPDSVVNALPLNGGRWEIRPLTRTFVGTVMWEVESVNGQRVAQRMTLESFVERRALALTASTGISRGQPLTKDCYDVEEVWLDRDLQTLFTNEKDALGLAAQRDIAPGEHLDRRDFKPLMLAQRGDTLTIIFMSGSLQVKMTAQARQDGKLHDSIEVENESTHEKYQATLIGKKLAVVGGTLTDAQEKQLREIR